MQRTTQQRPVGIQLPAQQPHLGVSLVKIASEPCNHVNARDNVLVEGRVHTTAQAAEAVRRGAWAVVVGTAITHPTSITRCTRSSSRTTACSTRWTTS